jgi:hypothetical protein
MTKLKRTTELLKEIAEGATKDSITMKEFNKKLGDRSFGLGLLIFGLLNFLPLMSAVFAIPVIFISLQMIIGLKSVKLPKFIEGKTFNEKMLAGLISKCLPTLKTIEMLIKPRLDFMTSPMIERFVGFICLFLGIIVFLPVPGANALPSFCICLMAVAILEKDGILMIVSVLLSLLTLYTIQAVIIALKNLIFRYLFN